MTIKTLASVGLALILTAILATQSDARSRRHHKHQESTESKLLTLLRKQSHELDQVKKELAALHKILQPEVTVFNPQSVPLPQNRILATPSPVPDITKPPAIISHIATTKLKQLTHGLALKVAEIMEACGSTLVSGYRPGARVKGSGRPSLHSRYPSQAADMHGNPKCIYRHLQGWPGGYSVDYAEVNHVHISLSADGRERHARFVHYGHKAHYYAHHHDASHRRLARLH